jgi:hypothetical protein
MSSIENCLLQLHLLWIFTDKSFIVIPDHIDPGSIYRRHIQGGNFGPILVAIGIIRGIVGSYLGERYFPGRVRSAVYWGLLC